MRNLPAEFLSIGGGGVGMDDDGAEGEMGDGIVGEGLG